jgi:hypothetical protein
MARNAKGMARVIAMTSVATLKASFGLLRFLIDIPPYSQRGVTLIRTTEKPSYELPVRTNKW